MTSEYRINLVLADRGWILERCANEIASRFDGYLIGDEGRSDVDLNYYINYSAFKERKSELEVAFFTHVEENPAAAQRFFDVATMVDVQICMTKRYAHQLARVGHRDVAVIPPGVDLDHFTPQVRIGVVGRTYPSGRKGEDLVEAVLDIKGIDWHFTGEGWPRESTYYSPEDLPAFYNSIDYLLVPSRYEGGPMSVIEALACGKEVIASDVGWVSNFPHIRFRNGDANSLRRVLESLVAKRARLRQSVESYTWERWAIRHDALFKRAIARKRKFR